MPKDLRSFLAERSHSHPQDVLHVARQVSIRHEITAIQHKLAMAGKHPVLVFDQPVRPDGSVSPYPVVANLTASRQLCADALGIHPLRVAMEYLAKINRRGEIVTLESSQAPVKEVVKSGADLDLFNFPAPVHFHIDPGQYLTASFVCTYDPDTGVDNSAAARLWVKEPRLLAINLLPASHSNLNLQKFWAKDEPMPVAVWIGHHPAAIIGTQVRKGYPDSHWASMAGCLDEPLRLVPTETHGDRLMVPADAEIVIEGFVPKGRLYAEGPFADFTGYAWGQRPNPVIEVTAVTHRRQALFHDYGAGLPDQLVIGNFPLEARIYEALKRSFPEVQNVHVPLSGHRHHVYVSIRTNRPGIARDIVGAALAVDTRVKHIVVVDDDVDIFSDEQVLWAIATRSYWDNDVIVNPAGAWYDGTLMPKGGIDATLPLPLGTGLPNFYAARNRLPEDVDRRIRLEDYIDPAVMAQLPGTF
ncbi:MAG: UbiD family decarboxylase [Chloroflexi bacterium]|nr:UbiD family decarboxylase [Chloroflexota bacterium]